MHNLQPNTQYRIIDIQIAVPTSINPSEVDDAISETLTGSMVADNIIADWQRTGVEHLTNMVKSVPFKIPVLARRHQFGSALMMLFR